MVNNLSIDPGDISKALSFIQDFLEENKLSDKTMAKARLLTEETLIKLSEHSAITEEKTVCGSLFQARNTHFCT